MTVVLGSGTAGDATASALGWIDAAEQGATGNGTTDDTTALQSAIDATPDGGTLYLPAGTYKTTAALVVDHAMTFRGAGIHELWGSVLDTKFSCLLPTQSPFLQGAVIVPSTAGQNAFNVTVAGLAVHMSDFGIVFAAAIRWMNTGHGIFARAPLIDIGYDNGVESGTLRNISVYGHDGNHYAFDFTNPMMNTWEHLRSYGGGGYHWHNFSSNVGFDNYAINYGNQLCHHTYAVMVCAGTAHGMFLEATVGVLNLLQFNRPQVWAYDVSEFLPVTPPASPQMLYKGQDANVRRVSIIQPDFEDNCGCNVEYTQLGAFIDPAGAAGNTAFAIFRPADFTFGNRSEARALWWNLDRHLLIPTGTAEEWGDYDVATNKYVNSSEVGPGTGVSYTRRGTTGERPTGMSEGGHYYDTTLHKPIWWNGSNWKDGAGNTV